MIAETIGKEKSVNFEQAEIVVNKESKKKEKKRNFIELNWKRRKAQVFLFL